MDVDMLNTAPPTASSSSTSTWQKPLFSYTSNVPFNPFHPTHEQQLQILRQQYQLEQDEEEQEEEPVLRSRFKIPMVGMRRGDPEEGLSEAFNGFLGDVVEWKYDMRRQAQMIIPGLVLGPHAVARKREELKDDWKVTHVLMVKDPKDADWCTEYFPGEFVYETIEMKDSQDERIIKQLQAACNFFETAIASGGVVYVHDLLGVSTSPTLVLAYLMQKFEVTFDQALTFLLVKRYCVCPNPGFVAQLKEFEALYKARLAINMYSPHAAINQNPFLWPNVTPGTSSKGQVQEVEMDGTTATVQPIKRDLDQCYNDDTETNSMDVRPNRGQIAGDDWVHNGALIDSDDKASDVLGYKCRS